MELNSGSRALLHCLCSFVQLSWQLERRGREFCGGLGPGSCEEAQEVLLHQDLAAGSRSAKTSRKSTASGTTGSCCRKSQCLHPDKPAMFACADCPRRTSKSASEEGLDSQPVAVAAFIGEEVATKACGRKSQCLHPDKPAMFACADCPRRTSKSASEEGLDSQPVAVAAFIGEEVATKACGRKSQCLHPDKPAMFACADCPRRMSKTALEIEGC
ncbi:unnamed protein product [Durusdinium trenchii]|uniref:Uncharacterized protein n=1 Tax=Durusdinium trenchii TaxID=1381693 RepID=A0ABP0MTG9_9DINO